MIKSDKYVQKINKIKKGVFYTETNIFKNKIFEKWFKRVIKKSNNTVLEPFAGKNNIIKMLKENNLKFKYSSFDINPKNKNVKYRNTIKKYPNNYKLTITNPPYLAKNSATRKKIKCKIKYDDIYKDCLEIMLKNSDYIAVIIPASFITTKLFFERLKYYIILNEKVFNDTVQPVCLAIFNKNKSKDFSIYENNKFIKTYKSLKRNRKKHYW